MTDLTGEDGEAGERTMRPRARGGTAAHRRRHAALTAALLVPIGIGTKLYSGPGSTWVVANLGGAVYVAFWTFLALAFRPGWSALRVAVAVFWVTSGIEFLQLWHPPFLEALRATVPGQAVLGGVFSWIDIPYYAAGALAAVALAVPLGWPVHRHPPRSEV